MSPQAVPPLAEELNQRLDEAAPELLSMLSALGRRLYFPKGILSQSAEAREKAHRFNATIGIATERGAPMYLGAVRESLGDVLSPAQVFPYAPPAGQQELRERWQEKMLRENPSLRDKTFGLPVVTSAITHGLSLVGDLFIDPGDVLLLPDKLWGNYRLNFEVRLGARVHTHPFYRGRGFDAEGLREELQRVAGEREKVMVLLNFPNNPTGYMPSEAEAQAIAAALIAQAERGTRLVVVLDDAYFGLFYHLEGPTRTESLFGLVANAHPNLLSIRLDGATKELFAWGLRCGFLTVAPGRLEGAEEATRVLDAKLRGAIRSGVSGVSQLSQSLISRALVDGDLDRERHEKCALLAARARRVREAAEDARFRDSWEVYPFNSGYFMCVRLRGVEGEVARARLLTREGIGVIAAGGSDIRVAFSCLEEEDVQPLFEALHRVVGDLQ